MKKTLQILSCIAVVSFVFCAKGAFADWDDSEYENNRKEIGLSASAGFYDDNGNLKNGVIETSPNSESFWNMVKLEVCDAVYIDEDDDDKTKEGLAFRLYIDRENGKYDEKHKNVQLSLGVVDDSAADFQTEFCVAVLNGFFQKIVDISYNGQELPESMKADIFPISFGGDEDSSRFSFAGINDTDVISVASVFDDSSSIGNEPFRELSWTLVFLEGQSRQTFAAANGTDFNGFDLLAFYATFTGLDGDKVAYVTSSNMVSVSENYVPVDPFDANTYRHLDTTPEPATLAILGIGVLGGALLRRRKRV